jgi:hypothetical protein
VNPVNWQLYCRQPSPIRKFQAYIEAAKSGPAMLHNGFVSNAARLYRQF